MKAIGLVLFIILIFIGMAIVWDGIIGFFNGKRRK